MYSTHFLRMLIWALIGILLAAVVPAQAESPGSASDFTVYVTSQRFERGVMYYRADTGYIWSLFDDGTTAGFPSKSYGTLPDNPYWGTPSGRIRPINGFGRIWGAHDWVRNRLGWALRPEFGFNSRVITQNQTVYLFEFSKQIIQIDSNNTWRYVYTIPDPPPDLVPYVNSFSVTPNPVEAGGTITVSWSVSGTDTVLVEVYNSSGQLFRLFENLPLTGVASLAVPVTEPASLRVVVWGANWPDFYVPVAMYERLVSAEVVISVRPTSPHTGYTRAAFQQYERGFMIWRNDTGEVMVFTGSQTGQVTSYPTTSYGTLPDNPYASPPVGYVASMRGFGKVWGNYSAVRDQLGWATVPEQGYDMTIRSYGGEVAYLLPDGRSVVVSPQGYWAIE